MNMRPCPAGSSRPCCAVDSDGLLTTEPTIPSTESLEVYCGRFGAKPCGAGSSKPCCPAPPDAQKLKLYCEQMNMNVCPAGSARPCCSRDAQGVVTTEPAPPSRESLTKFCSHFGGLVPCPIGSSRPCCPMNDNGNKQDVEEFQRRAEMVQHRELQRFCHQMAMQVCPKGSPGGRPCCNVEGNPLPTRPTYRSLEHFCAGLGMRPCPAGSESPSPCCADQQMTFRAKRNYQQPQQQQQQQQGPEFQEEQPPQIESLPDYKNDEQLLKDLESKVWQLPKHSEPLGEDQDNEDVDDQDNEAKKTWIPIEDVRSKIRRIAKDLQLVKKMRAKKQLAYQRTQNLKN